MARDDMVASVAAAAARIWMEGEEGLIPEREHLCVVHALYISA